jgi:protein-L-isoaspartate O-methyltransferase
MIFPASSLSSTVLRNRTSLNLTPQIGTAPSPLHIRRTRIPLLALFVALLLGLASPLPAQEDLGTLDEVDAQRVKSQTLSAFEGMPLPVVKKMLELARLRPNELLYDLGSGDGRVLIVAAQAFGARAVGIELDPRLYQMSLKRIWDLNLRDRVQVVEGDLLEQDWSQADVVTIYMTPYGLGMLQRRLEKFRHPGMRIVTCVDPVPGWEPTTAVTAQGDNQRSYKLYLYEVPKARGGASFADFGQPR